MQSGLVWSGLVLFCQRRGSREPLFIGERHVARAEGLLRNSPNGSCIEGQTIHV